VSERLKADFDDGKHYRQMQGREVPTPTAGLAPPSRHALGWNRENGYLGQDLRPAMTGSQKKGATWPKAAGPLCGFARG